MINKNRNRVILRDIFDADLLIFFRHQRDPIANELAAFPPCDFDPFISHWHNSYFSGALGWQIDEHVLVLEAG